MSRPAAREGLPGPGACSRYGHQCLLDAAHTPCAAEDLWAAGDGRLQSCFLEEVHHTHAHGMVSCNSSIIISTSHPHLYRPFTCAAASDCPTVIDMPLATACRSVCTASDQHRLMLFLQLGKSFADDKRPGGKAEMDLKETSKVSESTPQLLPSALLFHLSCSCRLALMAASAYQRNPGAVLGQASTAPAGQNGEVASSGTTLHPLQNLPHQGLPIPF